MSPSVSVGGGGGGCSFRFILRFCKSRFSNIQRMDVPVSIYFQCLVYLTGAQHCQNRKHMLWEFCKTQEIYTVSKPFSVITHI